MTPVLEVAGLCVDHGGLRALDRVDLTLAAGTVTGVIGPNGAGKTTLLDALSGFVGPSAGEITFGGRSVRSMPPHRRSRMGLVRTFQGVELFDDLSVRENVSVGRDRSSWRRTALDAVRADRSPHPDVEEVLADLGLGAIADRPARSLPHGTRRMVGLARALVLRPAVLMLDEPAAGLAPTEMEMLASLLARLPERGTTTLLVDHHMPLVMGVCDTVAVLDQGLVIAEGTPESVASDPATLAAYLGAP